MNYMKNINVPGAKESWESQLKAMDPNYFLELSIQNYGEKNLINV